MMKRVISLMTSLMMMASLIGGSVVQTPTVSAATETSTMSLKDTSVLNGVKTASVPVIISSDDIAAMDVSVKVTSDKAGEQNPVITGVRGARISKNGEELYNVQASSVVKKQNERGFIWNDENGKGVKFSDTCVAYVDIRLPETAVLGSSYTLAVTDSDYATESREKDLLFSTSSDITAKITVVTPAKYEGYITSMNDQNVVAGAVVAVPMTIKCPKEQISAIVSQFSVSGGASISGYVYNNNLDSSLYMESASNAGLMLWGPKEDNKGVSFEKETRFVSVLVKIPADAKLGDTFTIKLDKIDTSTVNREYLEPEKYASAVLKVADDVKTKSLTVEIGSDNVKKSQATVDVPVYVSYTTAQEGLAAVVAKFQVKNADGKVAKITSIKAGSAVGEDDTFQNAQATPEKALWFNAEGKNQSFAIVDNAKPVLFVLTVALPSDRAVGDEYSVSVVDKSLDISDANRVNLFAVESAGTITIIKDDDIIDGYKIKMDSVSKTATNDVMEVPVPVYLDGASLNTFKAAFKVSGGASIKSITSATYGNEITFGTENENRVIWQGAEGTDTKFTTADAFVVVNVEIPAELAKTGKTFVVSVDGTVDSANADRVSVFPTTPYGFGTITLTAPATSEVDMEMYIGSKDIESGTETVNIPVNVKVDDLIALDGKFILSGDCAKFAKITAVNSVAAANEDKVSATISESEKVSGGFLWAIEGSSKGIDFGKDTAFLELEISIDKNATEGTINVTFEGDGVVTNGKTFSTAVVKNDPVGVITIGKKSEVTTQSDTTPTGTATEPTGTATEPTGTATEPTGTATEPTGTATEPTGTATEPTGTATEPTGTATEPTGTATEPTGTVTEPTGTVTEPTGTTPVAPDFDPILTGTNQVKENIVTDITLEEGHQVEVKAADVEVAKDAKTADVDVNLADFDDNEHFEYASVKFVLPEGFTISDIKNIADIKKATASEIKLDAATNTVEMALVSTKGLAKDARLFTLVVNIPAGTKADKYPVKFSADSAFRRIIKTNEALTEADTATIKSVSLKDGSITVKDATVASKKIVAGTFKVTDPTTKFYYSHADKFDLTGLKVTVDVITTYSDKTTKTETVDITAKVALKGSATPATTYDKTKFAYKIALVYTDAELAAEGVTFDGFTALIGQKGDITLDHVPDVVDATIILKEAAKNVIDETTLPTVLEKIKAEGSLEAGLYDTIGSETLVKFMYFLGNVTEDAELDVVDATLILKFAAAAVVAEAKEEKFDVAAQWAGYLSKK